MQPMSAELTLQLAAAEAALARRDFQAAHAHCMAVLGAEPRTPQALFLLASIAAEHGNHGKALDVAGRAIAIDPGHAASHALRGRCFLALSRPREALEAARAGIAGRIDSAWVWDTLGVVLTRAGAHEEAIEPFRRAIALEAGKPAYHYNLGAALQFVGDFAAAETAYRAALALAPGDARTLSALAQLRKRPFAPAEVAALEAACARLAADPQADPDTWLHCAHALAKQREDEGDPVDAFRLLGPAKARKRASLDWRIGEDLEAFAAARESCDAGFLAAGGGDPSAEPIFIVGMPRTGTTLVERILSSHPEVFAAGELSHFSLALKRLAGTQGRRVLDAETLWAARRVDPAALGRMYIDSTRPRTGHTPRFIDKMPLNFHYAGIIRRALPNARILCLRRHPLDTIVSNYRQLFATGFAYYNYAFDLADTARYWQAFDALCAHWREQLGEGFLEVHYEDVVADLEGQARRILDHCGLPFDPACLAFHENRAPVATASSVQVRQPIYKSSVDRWKVLESELGPALAVLNA